MARFLELTEDQMVQELRSIQILAREMLNAEQANPFNPEQFSKSITAVVGRLRVLALEGDVV